MGGLGSQNVNTVAIENLRSECYFVHQLRRPSDAFTGLTHQAATHFVEDLTAPEPRHNTTIFLSGHVFAYLPLQEYGFILPLRREIRAALSGQT